MARLAVEPIGLPRRRARTRASGTLDVDLLLVEDSRGARAVWRNDSRRRSLVPVVADLFIFIFREEKKKEGNQGGSDDQDHLPRTLLASL
jgi:hypothetical protein